MGRLELIRIVDVILFPSSYLCNAGAKTPVDIITIPIVRMEYVVYIVMNVNHFLSIWGQTATCIADKLTERYRYTVAPFYSFLAFGPDAVQSKH